MSKRPHVAIVGAGFAGLRCADILIQNGAQVTVFEARDRVGGRVHQAMVGDHLVDTGPNWIHGTGTNPIVNVAEATGTILGDFEGRSFLIASDGKPVDEVVATKVSDFLWETIEEAFRYSNSHQDDIPAEKSLLDFIQEKLEKTKLSDEEKSLCVESSRLWGAYVGDPIERQSLKFFCLEECIDGNNYFVASTYKDILAHVSSTAVQHATIHFNQPIVKIDSKPAQGTRHEVTLTTEAGQSYTFDEVVVTCPLGWLKRNKSAFSPALPPRLTSAIDSISYGRLEKIYVTFPEAFWEPSSGTEIPPINESTRKSSDNNLSFAQFLHPSYTDHPPDILWNQECFSMVALPPQASHPTLLFYTYGPCATYIVNKLTTLNPSQSKSGPTETTPTKSPETYAFLTTLLRPFYSLLPHYTPSSPLCTPTSLLATTWQSDPHAGHGSYSNFQINLSHGASDIETLRNGAGLGINRGIWFAGEHTAPFVALGTTTGAFWSGERAAGAVCSVLGLGSVGVGDGRDDSLPSAGSEVK